MFHTDYSAMAMGGVVQYHSRSTVNDTIHFGDGSMIQCSTTREVRVRASCPYHRGIQIASSAAMAASRPPQPQQEGVFPDWCWCEIQGESGVTIDLDPDSESEDAQPALPIAHSAEDDDAVYVKNFPEHGDHGYKSGLESEIDLDCEDSLVTFSSERHATHHPDSQSTVHVQDEVLDSVASCLIASMSPKMEDEDEEIHLALSPQNTIRANGPCMLAPNHVQDEVPGSASSCSLIEPILSSKTKEEAQEEASQRSPQKPLRANWSCMSWTP